MSYEIQLITILGVLLISGICWSLMGAQRIKARLLGSTGVGLAAVIVAAMYWSKYVPLLWSVPQLVLALWMASFALIGVYFMDAIRQQPTDWLGIFSGATAGLANTYAFLLFMWMAMQHV